MQWTNFRCAIVPQQLDLGAFDGCGNADFNAKAITLHNLHITRGNREGQITWANRTAPRHHHPNPQLVHARDDQRGQSQSHHGTADDQRFSRSTAIDEAQRIEFNGPRTGKSHGSLDHPASGAASGWLTTERDGRGQQIVIASGNPSTTHVRFDRPRFTHFIWPMQQRTDHAHRHDSSGKYAHAKTIDQAHGFARLEHHVDRDGRGQAEHQNRAGFGGTTQRDHTAALSGTPP